MENNLGQSGQFKEEPHSRMGSSTSDNFQEFKHNALLHEKGVEMQDDNDHQRNPVKVKFFKSKTHSNKPNSIDQLAENFEEENELRERFKEKHL